MLPIYRYAIVLLLRRSALEHTLCLAPVRHILIKDRLETRSVVRLFHMRYLMQRYIYKTDLRLLSESRVQAYSLVSYRQAPPSGLHIS